MARRASIQVTAAKGELDPDLSSRVDLEHYYDSVALATNTLFHPQGGFSDRGGFELVSDAALLASGTGRRLRRAVVPHPIGAANLTAWNGGLVSFLVDQSHGSSFTTNPVTSAAFVVVECDFTVPVRIDFVDVINFKCETGAYDRALSVEYYEGGVWKPFADVGAEPAKHLRTSLRTRRFGTSPGGLGGVPVIARQWRLVVRGASGCGAISVGGLEFWREVSRQSPRRLLEVARDGRTSAVLVVSDRNIDVYEQQRYVASIRVPVAAQQVAEIGSAGGFDTLVLLHEMVETQRIVRQGTSLEWDVRAAPFTDIPALTEGTVYSGDQNEIQDLLVNVLPSQDLFVIMLGDMRTPALSRSDPLLLSAIRDALKLLPGVATGAGDVLVTSVAGGVRVEMAGANGARSWPLMQVIGLSDASPAVETRVVQQGVKSSAALFGPFNGWPRCGAFVQQRFLVAGFRAAPTSWRFSQNSNPWSMLGLDLQTPTADRAFGGALDVDSIDSITRVFVGRHLQFFTDAGAWYAEVRSLDATQPFAMQRATNDGLARGVPIVFADGATLFMQREGRTLREFLYQDIEQSYTAEPVSLLAPHHLTGVVDMAALPALSVSDGNLVAMVNADGSMAVLTLLRGQKVVAGARWTTLGAFRNVLSTVKNELLVVAERLGEHWLEQWTPDTPLDFATRLSGAPRTVVDGAGHLEGRTDVWCIADDDVLGPFTVTNGAFVLPAAASSIAYGLAPEWRVRTNVLRESLRNAQPFRTPARIYEVEISMRATGALTLGANEGPVHPLPLARTGHSLDWGGPLQTEDGGAPQLPLLQRLYTGDVVRTGLLGWTNHPVIELGRSKPAPVHIKAIRYEIAYKGGE